MNSKITFKNKLSEYLPLGYSILIVIISLYQLIQGDFNISFVLSGILIYLIFTKHRYAKQGIKILSILSILVGILIIGMIFISSDELIGKLLFLIAGGVATITIGLVMLLNGKYVVIDSNQSISESIDNISALEKLHSLKEKGIISEEEFQSSKKELI
jgi:hypothetical protein